MLNTNKGGSMTTNKDITSIKNDLKKIETILKELSLSNSLIEDRLSDIEFNLDDLLSSVENLENQIVSDVDGMVDNVRNNIENDIQSAVSDINSNIDRLKD